MRLARFRSVAVLLLTTVLAISACANGESIGSPDQDGTNISSAATVAGASEGQLADPDEQLSFFPEGLVDDLNTLQWAIDLRFDQDRVQCLREAGWDVRPNSLESIQANNTSAVGPLAQVQMFLASGAVDDIGNPTTDPNSDYYATLSEQELGEMYEQNSVCVEQSKWNRGHPLGEQGTAYADAYSVASDRVVANDDYLTSLATADRCFEESGFGPRPEALGSIANSAIDLLVQLEAAEIDRDTALDEAARLENLQTEVAALEVQCYESHNRLTASLFADELSNEVSRSPELQTEILRLESFVAEYRDILDDIEANS